MARIAGIELPRGKRADIALTYIYGIGRATALENARTRKGPRRGNVGKKK